MSIKQPVCAVCNGKSEHKKPTSFSFLKSLSLPYSRSFLVGLDVKSMTICKKKELICRVFCYYKEYWTCSICFIREQIFSSWDRDCYSGSGIRIVNSDGIRKSFTISGTSTRPWIYHVLLKTKL